MVAVSRVDDLLPVLPDETTPDAVPSRGQIRAFVRPRRPATLDDLAGRTDALERSLAAFERDVDKRLQADSSSPDPIERYVVSAVAYALGDTDQVLRQISERVVIAEGRLEALWHLQASQLRAVDLRLEQLQAHVRLAFFSTAAVFAAIAFFFR